MGIIKSTARKQAIPKEYVFHVLLGNAKTKYIRGARIEWKPGEEAKIYDVDDVLKAHFARSAVAGWSAEPVKPVIDEDEE